MKLNPPNAHRSQIKICEKRQRRNVQFRFMQNAFRILKPIQKSSKCVWVFHNTGANAVAKNQTRLVYEDKRDLYCSFDKYTKRNSVSETVGYSCERFPRNILGSRTMHASLHISWSIKVAASGLEPATRWSHCSKRCSTEEAMLIWWPAYLIWHQYSNVMKIAIIWSHNTSTWTGYTKKLKRTTQSHCWCYL